MPDGSESNHFYPESVDSSLQHLSRSATVAENLFEVTRNVQAFYSGEQIPGKDSSLLFKYGRK